MFVAASNKALRRALAAYAVIGKVYIVLIILWSFATGASYSMNYLLPLVADTELLRRYCRYRVRNLTRRKDFSDVSDGVVKSLVAVNMASRPKPVRKLRSDGHRANCNVANASLRN